ncbi:uncharacterized protein SCODWIG_03784 [Saccharomycodes ludwigii]|uniref:Uncharacterized protein n=1 Tax=Saccharomycodes ludwigii TaxID=36035 RepID=A0A376BBF5_9ASCO|nr:uncharacterized protein SCODWIG_03784 [Saccharomycodes ludwigii]
MSDQEELFKYWLKFKDISTRLFGNKRKRVNEPLVLHGNDRFLSHHYCIDSNYYLISGKVNSELCTCAFYDYNNPDLASSYSYDHQYFHDEKQLISNNKCLDNQDGLGDKYLKVELLDCSVEFENFQKDLNANIFSNNLLCCYKNMVIVAMAPDLVLQKQPSGILVKINLESIVSKACKHFLNNYKSAFMEYNETLGNEVLGKSWEITFIKMAKFYGKDLLMLCLTNGFVFCAFCEDVYQNETFEPLFQLKTELSCWSIDIFDDGPIKVFAVGSNERTVTLFFHDSHNKEIQPNKSNIVYKIGRIPCSDNVPTVAFYPKRTSEGNAILYYGNIIGQIVSVKIFLKPNKDYKGTNFTDEPFAYKYLNSQFLGTQCWSISLLFENEICKDFLKVSSWEELSGCPNKTLNSIQEHNVLQDYLILDNLRYDDFDGYDKTVKTYGTGAKIARIPVPTQSLLERCVIYDDNDGFISTEVHINSGELATYPFDTFDEYTNLYGIGENELCYNDLRAPGKNGILTEHMRRKFDKLYTKIRQQRNKKTEKKTKIQDLISITNPIASSAEQGISEFLKDRAQEVGDIVQVSFNSILSKADKFIDAFDFIYNYHLAGYDMRNYYPGPILRIGEFLEQYGINTRKQDSSIR